MATLITVMSLGHWLEMRAIRQARGALSSLAELLLSVGALAMSLWTVIVAANAQLLRRLKLGAPSIARPAVV